MARYLIDENGEKKLVSKTQYPKPGESKTETPKTEKSKTVEVKDEAKNATRDS